jgi:hypothetical protein
MDMTPGNMQLICILGEKQFCGLSNFNGYKPFEVQRPSEFKRVGSIFYGALSVTRLYSVNDRVISE